MKRANEFEKCNCNHKGCERADRVWCSWLDKDVEPERCNKRCNHYESDDTEELECN